MNSTTNYKPIMAALGSFALSLLAASCCPPFCTGNCHSIPSSDSILPTASLTIEYWDGNGQPQVETITADKTIHVSENQRFNIIYSGADNVGIKYLWLQLSWTQWAGSIPQLVEPMVAPTDFGGTACSPRSASQKFTWPGGPRVYRFSVLAEDYHQNRGHSAPLTVVYGQPPEDIHI
jgi:hypothetical protein